MATGDQDRWTQRELALAVSASDAVSMMLGFRFARRAPRCSLDECCSKVYVFPAERQSYTIFVAYGCRGFQRAFFGLAAVRGHLACLSTHASHAPAQKHTLETWNPETSFLVGM